MKSAGRAPGKASPAIGRDRMLDVVSFTGRHHAAVADNDRMYVGSDYRMGRDQLRAPTICRK